jgi:hypothetical protein
MAITSSSPNDYNRPLGITNEVYNQGGWNWLKMTGLSSDIPISTSPTALAFASGGDIYIDNVIMEVGATGLAGGTNFEVIASEVVGLAVFFAETVANLGANTTVDMFTASVAKQRTVIQQGTHISIGSTAAKCTGSAVWTLTVVYRPCGVDSAVLSPYATFIPLTPNPPSPV